MTASRRVARRWLRRAATLTSVPYLQKVYDALVGDPAGWGTASPAGRLIQRKIRNLSNEFSGGSPQPLAEFYNDLEVAGIDNDELAVARSVKAPRARRVRKPTHTLYDAYRNFDDAVGASIALVNVDLDSAGLMAVLWMDAWRKAIVSLKGPVRHLWDKHVPKIVLRNGSRGSENASWDLGRMVLVLKPEEKPFPVTSLRGFLIHELGHAFEGATAARPARSALYGQPPYVSAYAGTNAEEDFAETFRALFTEPRQLKQKAPAKYFDMRRRLK